MGELAATTPPPHLGRSARQELEALQPGRDHRDPDLLVNRRVKHRAEDDVRPGVGLGGDLARRPVSLQLHDHEVALGIDAQDVDEAAEVGFDLV